MLKKFQVVSVLSCIFPTRRRVRNENPRQTGLQMGVKDAKTFGSITCV